MTKPTKPTVQTQGWLQTTTWLFGLACFSISQPLYTVLAESPELFTSYGFSGNSFIAFSVMIALVPPLLLSGIVAIASLLSPSWSRHLARLFIGLLCFVFSLQLLPELAGHGYIKTAMAIALGAAAVVALERFQLVQLWVNCLVIGVVAFPFLFLNNPNIEPLLIDARDSLNSNFKGAEHPVIFVIFDKLPTAALIEENREIDPAKYPNFAAFAERAYWFRNNTSSAQDTITSLPTILTGRYPGEKLPPTHSSHPDNLFTLLDDQFYMNVLEYVTQLAPEGSGQYQGSPTTVLRSLAADTALIYLHVILPSEFTRRLPSLEGKTSHFWQDDDVLAKRGPKRMQDFIDRLGGESRWFHYLHIDLPHGPYMYRASGAKYASVSSTPGISKEWAKWGRDRAPIDKALQRFLQQVALADGLLGNLVTQLRDLGIYDEALIIVTSDHGGGFYARDHTRAITMKNYLDVLYVPLFIKLPGQPEGVVSDINSELVDVFPTIVDLLGSEIPWPVDGISLFREDRVKASKFARAYLKGVTNLYEFPADNGGEFSRLTPLTPQRDWGDDTPHTDWGDLLGREFAAVSEEFYEAEGRGDSGFIEDPDLTTGQNAFELENGWLRGMVEKPAAMADGGSKPATHAGVIYEGRVIAITPLFQHLSHPCYFAELLPEKYVPLDATKLLLRILK